VREGRIASLEQLGPELVWLSIKLLADDATAERALANRRLLLKRLRGS
jgi:hypothetical protein